MVEIQMRRVVWFTELSVGDVALVGGKNSSLGEPITRLGSQGVRVPAGITITADAYWEVVDANDLRPVVARELDRLHAAPAHIAEVGAAIRTRFLAAGDPAFVGHRRAGRLPASVCRGRYRGSLGRRSLVGDCRGPSRCELRRAATLAAPFHPHPVILPLGDFKTNEYATLLGGAGFEPDEENPMIGWRGASRYYDPGYRDGFALECRAIRKVRDEMGFTNVIVMVPFCRTPEEADRVVAVMAEEGLSRGVNGLEVYVMAEIPSNIILTEAFAERLDGFSIGSNELS